MSEATAIPTETGSSSEQHVRSYFEAIAARDAAGLGRHWREDGIEELLPIGILRGRAEIEGFFRELFAALPDVETRVLRVVGEGDRVAAEWRMAGTFSGAPFQGIEPNGKRMEIRGLDLFELEGGKLASNTAYYDGMAFARQVGLLPPEGSGAERAMKGAFNSATKLRKSIAQRRGR